jgi:hypothetical protein
VLLGNPRAATPPSPLEPLDRPGPVGLEVTTAICTVGELLPVGNAAEEAGDSVARSVLHLVLRCDSERHTLCPTRSASPFVRAMSMAILRPPSGFRRI